MIRSRDLGVLLCALLLLPLAACDDPTSVGGGLIGEPNVGPKRVELDLAVDTVQYAPVTGSASITGVSRFLAGQTTDDPLGDVTATGYVDFMRASAPADLPGRTIESVELRLTPEYFYGDTTQAPTYGLYDMEAEWEAAGARADTSLTGTVEAQRITTFSVQPSDTLKTVTLPDGWVNEHADELKTEDDSTFADEFHGFQIRPLSGSSVAGFTSTATSLRVVFEDPGEEVPEAVHRLTRQLTTIRQPNPQRPENRYVLQDGTGRTLSFRFNLPDSLDDVALNSATLIFEVDSTLASAPNSFARPRIDSLDLYSATDTLETQPRLIPGAQFTLSPASPRFENNFPLIDLVQNILLGNSDLEQFQVRPSLQVVQVGPRNVRLPVPSLNSALIRRDAGHRPRLVLTYTSTEE